MGKFNSNMLDSNLLKVPLSVPDVPINETNLLKAPLMGDMYSENAMLCHSLIGIEEMDCFILRLPNLWRKVFHLSMAPAFLDYWLYADITRARRYCPGLEEVNVAPLKGLRIKLDHVKKNDYGAEIDECVQKQVESVSATANDVKKLKRAFAQANPNWDIVINHIKNLKQGESHTISLPKAIKTLPQVDIVQGYSKLKSAFDYATDSPDLDAAASFGVFSIQAFFPVTFKKISSSVAETTVSSFFWRVFDEYSFNDHQPLGIWLDYDIAGLPKRILTNGDFRNIRGRMSQINTLIQSADRGKWLVSNELKCLDFNPVTDFIENKLPQDIRCSFPI